MTDQQLLHNFQHNEDTQSLGVLLERYTLLLFGVCMKYMKDETEARDCVQQIFLKVISELQKYPVEYFKSWIYMVAKNHCLMKLRNKQGRQVLEIHEERLLGEPDLDISKLVEEDKVYDFLAQSLKDLNPEQQQCVTLFYLEKKSYQQISEQTGYTLLQVKSYIQNGKRNLKNLIEKKMKDQ